MTHPEPCSPPGLQGHPGRAAPVPERHGAGARQMRADPDRARARIEPDPDLIRKQQINPQIYVPQ